MLPEDSNLSVQQTDNLPLAGESPLFMLGKNQAVVSADVKDPAGAGNQFHLDSGAEIPPQLLLQTGGPGLVVSGCAVGNDDLHELFLLDSTLIILSHLTLAASGCTTDMCFFQSS
jgi:hypothetical protein